ncbi:MAG TPA: hypothetical protein VEG27_06905 [Usitatibacter sp.]|nr:hypothetical protein [Usitatibacter sp.]
MRRIFTACAMAAGAALATTASATVPRAYLAHLPPERHTSAGIEYLTGGRSPAEAESVKRVAHDFPLEVVFVERDRAGASVRFDNPVVIRDVSGKVVFSGRTDGPYFLAKLPPGYYTVTTRWQSWSFTKPVTIGGERQRVVFRWAKLAPAPAGSLTSG